MGTYISPNSISSMEEISNINEILSLKTENKKLLEVIGHKVSVIKNTTEEKNKNHKNENKNSDIPQLSIAQKPMANSLLPVNF